VPAESPKCAIVDARFRPTFAHLLTHLMRSLQLGSLRSRLALRRGFVRFDFIYGRERVAPVLLAPTVDGTLQGSRTTKILTKTLCDLYAFLMLKSLVSVSVCLSRIATQSAMAKEAEMLAVTFIVSCLSVCGFYVYVLVQLRREEKRGDAHKRHLAEHLYEMESEHHQSDAENPEDPDFLSSGRTPLSNSEAKASLRRETMLGVGLTVGGLAALFAGIEFFNSLVTWLHWY
jgi:hypothetical protein